MKERAAAQESGEEEAEEESADQDDQSGNYLNPPELPPVFSKALATDA